MIKNIETFFDKLASNWNYDTSKYEIREKLISLMDLSQNSVIADIGCGKGILFEHLLKVNPAKIIAVDVSGEMIRYAKNLHIDNRIEYIHGDFLKVTLPKIDAIVFFNSYPHFLDKHALVHKLSKSIKKGGTIIIAHSLSKEEVNAIHNGECVSKISVPLESAEIESNRFQDFFITDKLIDNDNLYLVRMTRK